MSVCLSVRRSSIRQQPRIYRGPAINEFQALCNSYDDMSAWLLTIRTKVSYVCFLSRRAGTFMKI